MLVIKSIYIVKVLYSYMSYRKSKRWEELTRDNFGEEGLWKFPTLEIVAV